MVAVMAPMTTTGAPIPTTFHQNMSMMCTFLSPPQDRTMRPRPPQAPAVTEKPRPRLHRVPVVTVVCLSAALLIVLGLVFVPFPNPYVAGYLRLAGVLVVVPPLLGLVGAMAALLDRRLDQRDRAAWAVGSAMAGFIGVMAYFVLGTLIFGP